MDQSRYWIQKEGNNNFLTNHPHVLSSFGDSWEEQAFAEDASGALGGCIWPPRSYTCSFCRREFRSAQALGGHMNVHRRDRARLKQVSSTLNNNQVLEAAASTSLDRCVLKIPNNHEISNPNFDLDHRHHHDALFSSSSPRRPSTVSIIPRPAAFTCSFGHDQEQQKSTPVLSWSSFEPPRRRSFHISDFGNQELKGCTQVDLESNSIINSKKKNNHQIEVRVASSLIRKRCEMPTLNDNADGLDDSFIFKRRRSADDDSRSFFPRDSSILVNNEKAATKVVIVPLEHSPNSTLENYLDLELRLGDHRP